VVSQSHSTLFFLSRHLGTWHGLNPNILRNNEALLFSSSASPAGYYNVHSSICIMCAEVARNPTRPEATTTMYSPLIIDIIL